MWGDLFGYGSIVFATLLVAAMSGLFSERAGVVNISIDGMMIIGALVFVVIGRFANTLGTYGSNFIQFAAMVIAMIVGGLFALLHGYGAISLKANQVIVGTAINLLAEGIGLFVVTLPFAVGNRIDSNFTVLAIDSQFKLVNAYVIIAVILAVAGFAFFRWTRTGLRYAATGENPNAVDAAGINVVKTRYAAIVISGSLAALAGCFFTFTISNTFRGDVQGQGYIALGIMIFGQWRTQYISLGAMIFSFLYAIAMYLPHLNGVSDSVKINSEIFKIIPFVLTIVTMVAFAKSSRMPKADGIPFNKSLR